MITKSPVIVFFLLTLLFNLYALFIDAFFHDLQSSSPKFSRNFVTVYRALQFYLTGEFHENQRDLDLAIEYYNACFHVDSLATQCIERIALLCARMPISKHCSGDQTSEWHIIATKTYHFSLDALYTRYSVSLGSQRESATRDIVRKLFNFGLFKLKTDDITSSLDLLTTALDKHAELTEFIDKVVSKDELLYHTGLCYQRMGNIINAHSLYWQALNFNNRNVRARVNLGVLLQQNQQYDDALFHYQRVLDYSTNPESIGSSQERPMLQYFEDYNIVRYNTILLLYQAGLLNLAKAAAIDYLKYLEFTQTNECINDKYTESMANALKYFCAASDKQMMTVLNSLMTVQMASCDWQNWVTKLFFLLMLVAYIFNFRK